MPAAVQRPALEQSAPIARYAGVPDARAAAECLTRRLPPGYPWQTHIGEDGTAAIVTAFLPPPAMTMIPEPAFRWQVRLTAEAAELRSTRMPDGTPFADRLLYDAIAACGLSR